MFCSFPFSVLEHHLSDAALDHSHWGSWRCRELVALGRGKLPPGRAWGPPGAAVWGRRRALGTGSSGLWVQQLPVAPAELSAVLHFPSLQPCPGQADFLPLWSCWNQALSYSHPCSLSLLYGGGTKWIVWFLTTLENRELDSVMTLMKLVVNLEIGTRLSYGPLLPSPLAFNQERHCWRLVTGLIRKISLASFSLNRNRKWNILSS